MTALRAAALRLGGMDALREETESVRFVESALICGHLLCGDLSPLCVRRTTFRHASIGINPRD
jgi:hypothetical protein